MRERDHDAVRGAALGGDALGGRARIGGRDDRPADDEVAGAGRERLGGAQRPALIVLGVAGAADARRDDGEPLRHSGARMSAISCGEATTPSRPAACASAASRSTCVGHGAVDADLGQRRLDQAGQHRHGDDERRGPRHGAPPLRRRPSRAARIIALPPDAWTLTIQTPSRVAAATAPATVFGMSWNFRSRKTRSPRADELLDDRRPVAGEQPAADLEAADGAAQRVGERARLVGGVDVERDEELIHSLSLRRAVSTVPTRSATRVDLVALHVVARCRRAASAR